MFIIHTFNDILQVNRSYYEDKINVVSGYILELNLIMLSNLTLKTMI